MGVFILLLNLVLLFVVGYLIWQERQHLSGKGLANGKSNQATLVAIHRQTSLVMQDAVEKATQAVIQAALKAIGQVKFSVGENNNLQLSLNNESSRQKPVRASAHWADSPFLSEEKARYKRLEKELQSQIREVEQKYVQFINSLEKQTSTQLNQQEEKVLKEIEQVSSKITRTLEEFSRELEEGLIALVDQKMGQMEQGIAEYKKQQQDLIDRQIVSLLERVLELTLNKRLSLQEQTDLVLQALEQAKKEGFFS